MDKLAISPALAEMPCREFTGWQWAEPQSSGFVRSLHWLLILSGVLAVCCVPVSAQNPGEGGPVAQPVERLGFLVDVPLPLVGQRDEQVRRQISRIADAHRNAGQRPVVVLQFKVAPLMEESGVGPDNGGLGTRGSQFERCLALARFLTSSEAARVRLIAYLPETIEGHAVLPVLACEEILAASNAELGRATIDEPLDATVSGAYRDVVARRATLPQPVVMAMLDSNAEVYFLELADGGALVVDRAEANRRREAGEVLREETVWAGGSLAQFNGQQLRNRRWIARTVDDVDELATALDLSAALRGAQQLPRQWNAVRLTLGGQLDGPRVNQIIRGLTEAIDKRQVNLVVIELSQTNSGFQPAARLASFVAGLDPEQVYTLGIVTQPLTGPAALVAIASDEAVVVSGASIGPSPQQELSAGEAETMRIVLGDLARTSGRPLPLLSAMVDADVVVNQYVHQESGKRAIFADWQVAKQADAKQWLAKARVAGGEPLDNEMAVRYRLIDAVDENSGISLGRLGLDQIPPELSTPWLDRTIERLLAQPWLPRLLLTIGFFCLDDRTGQSRYQRRWFAGGDLFLGFLLDRRPQWQRGSFGGPVIHCRIDCAGLRAVCATGIWIVWYCWPADAVGFGGIG
jgi:membrane-bound serine protease (ClpP class)